LQSLASTLSIVLLNENSCELNHDELIENLVVLMNHPSTNVRKTIVLLMVDVTSKINDKMMLNGYLRKFNTNQQRLI
jgi:hypothetical protein